jgi:hypothetical protein
MLWSLTQRHNVTRYRGANVRAHTQVARITAPVDAIVRTGQHARLSAVVIYAQSPTADTLTPIVDIGR